MCNCPCIALPVKERKKVRIYVVEEVIIDKRGSRNTDDWVDVVVKAWRFDTFGAKHRWECERQMFERKYRDGSSMYERTEYEEREVVTSDLIVGACFDLEAEDCPCLNGGKTKWQKLPDGRWQLVDA